MAKHRLLWTSILAVASLIGFWQLPDQYFGSKLILFAAAALLWMLVTFMIYSDARSVARNRAYTAFGLLAGGVGGIAYAIIAWDDIQKSDATRPNPQVRTFSTIVAVLLSIALILTLPFSEHAHINWTKTGTIIALLALSILGVVFGKD